MRPHGFIVRAALAHVLVLAALACGDDDGSPTTDDCVFSKPAAEDTENLAMKLRSPAFAPHERMNPEHTCDGAGLSPPLTWSDVPSGTKSLALVVEDPDAPDPAHPQRIWVHWVVYDIPTDVRGLPEGASTRLPAGARTGMNDWKQARYGGPCPPIGCHRYVHTLYALDTVLGLETADRASLLRAMEGHVLDRAELVGMYERPRR